MPVVKITFSNGELLTLKEGDFITPIVLCENKGESFASMSKPEILEFHVQNGLTPSLMNVLCRCNFFFVNDEQSVSYGTHSIVKIKTD